MTLNETCAKCAETGDLEGLKRALKQGADVNFQDARWGWTPLMWAIYGGQQHVVQYLCTETRSDPNLVDVNGKIALHVACKNGKLESAKYLVERGSDINYMATQPADSWTPLMYASHHGWPDLIKYLISAGADTSIRSIHGKTAEEFATDPNVVAAFHSAKSEGEVEKVDVFLSLTSSDTELGQKLKEDFEKNGLVVTFSCPEEGDDFLKFNKQIQKARVFVALLSNDYAEATICRKQVNFADGLKKNLVTIVAKDGTNFPPLGPMGGIMAGMLYQDMTLKYATYEQSFQQVLPQIDTMIKAVASKEQSQVPIASPGAPPELIAAIESGNIEVVRDHIARGFDMNKGDTTYRWTPLMWACYTGHHEIVELLCTEGLSDTHYIDSAGKQALHIACKNGNLNSVTYLVERGADMNYKSPVPADSWTPLMYASSGGFAEIVEFLARRGADKFVKDVAGKTAIEYAYNEAIKTILRTTNADFEKQSTDVFLSYNWTHQETVKKMKEVIEKAGLTVWMDINQMGAGDYLFAEIDAGMRTSTVVVACVTKPYANSLNCRKEIWLCDGLKKPMIPIKLDPNVSWPPEGPMSSILHGKNPIDFTTQSFEEAMGVLVPRLKAMCAERAASGPKVIRGKYDQRLFDSATNGDLQGVREAINAGADPNVPDQEYSWTPLMWAVYGNHHDVVEYLCKEGRADVDIVDKWGKTALHVGAKNGKLDIIRFLVERGANVNYLAASPKDTWTPLMYAVNHNFPDIVVFLIQCGADISIANGVGSTAIGLAASKPQILAILQNASTSIETPLRVEAHVFISYFGAQLEFAKRVRDELASIGITAWLDEGQFGKEDVFWAAVDFGMRSARVVIPIISDAFSSRIQYQKEMNLCDGLRKPAVSLVAVPGASFPPAGIMGPILAPFPHFDLSTNFQAGWVAALPAIQSAIHN